MMLPLTLVLTATVFIAQLLICFFCPVRRYKRYLTVTLVTLDGLCWLVFLLSLFLLPLQNAGFAAFLWGLVGLLLLAGDGLGWGLYRFVKMVQNLIK